MTTVPFNIEEFVEKIDVCMVATHNRYGHQRPVFSFDNDAYSRFRYELRQGHYHNAVDWDPRNRVRLYFGGRSKLYDVVMTFMDLSIIVVPEVPGVNCIPWQGGDFKNAALLKEPLPYKIADTVASEVAYDIVDMSDAVFWALDNPCISTYAGIPHKESHNAIRDHQP